MNYPNVKNSHIYPKLLQKPFAVDGKIGVGRVRDGERLVRDVRKAGTRRRAYRRERPDGTPIDDVEWSLSALEDVAAPVLASLDDLWPLAFEDKRKLAELFAYQALRGPRWMAEHDRFSEEFTAEAKRTGKITLDGKDRHLTAEELDAIEDLHAQSIGNTGRLTQMLRIGPNITSAFGSMHWTLVEFADPLVATSDQPVVIWPLAQRSREPAPTPLGTGVLATLEVRVPLSPRQALLMTWSDLSDEAENRIRGLSHHAENFNAFTIASADEEWFFLPRTHPPTIGGKLPPLSIELVPGYGPELVEKSLRRTKVSEHIQSKLGRELSDREIMIVTLT